MQNNMARACATNRRHGFKKGITIWKQPGRRIQGGGEEEEEEEG